MLTKDYTLGVDIGSTTVKVALLDANKNLIFSDYKRHFANIRETMQDLVQEAYDQVKDVRVHPVITGSGGLALAGALDIPFTHCRCHFSKKTGTQNGCRHRAWR